ncbi:unnamed protein product [Chrysoparadoxa australica]
MDAAKIIAAIAYTAPFHLPVLYDLARDSCLPSESEGNMASQAVVAPLPLITIPLTVGVGAEVTPVALLTKDELALEPTIFGLHSSQAALPTPFMSIVEPRLMKNVPSEIAWSGAFAALIGCIEGFVSGTGYVPDALSCQGIERVGRCMQSAREARDEGGKQVGLSYAQQEAVAQASVASGLVRSRSQLTLVDALAAATSCSTGVPHAIALARLYPGLVKLMLGTEEDCPTRPRYQHAAMLASGVPGTDLTKWLEEALHMRRVPTLGTLGLSLEDVPGILGTNVVIQAAEAAGIVPVALQALFQQELSRPDVARQENGTGGFENAVLTAEKEDALTAKEAEAAATGLRPR